MDAIILAAGLGKRTKLHEPKQLFRLGGIPIFIRIINIFQSIDEIDKIILAVIQGQEEYFSDILKDYNIKNIEVISGGNTRQESVYRGLKHVTTEKVIIHEAARPFINKEFLERLIHNENDNVVPILNIPFTVCNLKEKYYPNRQDVVNIQLPQKFNTKLLKEAHFKYEGYDFTDDSSLFALVNGIDNITYIEGLEENIKITLNIDTKIAEVIYSEYCTGNWGF